MQSALSGSTSSLGLGNPPDLAAKRKSLHRIASAQPSQPTRVVVAEGSEFVLETPPQRSTAPAIRQAGLATDATPRHLRTSSGSSARASVPSTSQSQPRPQPRAVSASTTPPRTRQTDRPYRPPPSSSARFYERQQQLWQLQYNGLEEPSPQLHAPSSSYLPSIPGATTDPSVPSLPLLLPPRSPSSPQNHGRYTMRAPSSIQASTTSIAQGPSHLGLPSVGTSAAPNGAAVHRNRARSGSDVSFTRSCVSRGYMSQTDEDSYDEPARSTVSRPPLPTLPAPERKEQPHRRAQLAVAPTLSDLGDSNDLDWDADLGISSDYSSNEQLRFPLQARHGAHLTATVRTQAAAPVHETISSELVVNSVAAPLPTDTNLQNPHSIGLKGIRVTSAVSEIWDDDFLFQNEEEDPTDTAPTWNAGSSQAGTSSSSATKTARKTPPAKAHQNYVESDDDGDVENWDDAFLWNADPSLTPSASISSSLASLRQDSASAQPGIPGLIAREKVLPSGKVPASRPAALQKRWSDSSSASDITNFSLRLAAQSDVDTYDPRVSCDSDVSFASASRSTNVRQNQNSLQLAGTRLAATSGFRKGSDSSGDDTETEAPSRELDSSLASSKASQTRPARRSLGAALGFKTQNRPLTRGSDAKMPSSPHAADEDSMDAGAARSHKRTSSRPKLGALQRLSFSRSRTSVTNASNASIDEIPSANRRSQQIYMDKTNLSQASLVSQRSTSSTRSSRPTSPASLAKSYSALRSSSFRRLLGRGSQSRPATSEASELPILPPTSPSRYRSDIPLPPEGSSGLSSDNHSGTADSTAMSPPSAWLGIRRSSETTPTRPMVREIRRGSDGPRQASSAQACKSPAKNSTKLPSLPKRDRSGYFAERITLTGSEGTSSVDAGSASQSGTSADASSAGLHRDFSSSKTLRADSSELSAIVRKSAQLERGAQPQLSFAEPLGRAEALGESRYRSPASAADSLAMSLDHKQGESMVRGLGDSASASRSVSASTTHSHTSAESLYGYRMRKQVSTSSGADAHDSETSYGTSVGSSPGLSQLSSSGWFSNAKYGPASSVDTRTTSWSHSHDASDRLPWLYGQQDGDDSSAVSVSTSPAYLEKTLEGTPARSTRDTRLLSAPDTPTSPSNNTGSCSADTSFTDSPVAASRNAASRYRRPAPTDQAGSIVGTGAPEVPQESTNFPKGGPSRPRNAARRNSLSDLKIPSRISKAQTGIRNNINLVRDFAKGIEELKALKSSYLDRKERAAPLDLDTEKGVQNWLECADVLIGLGQGRSDADSTADVETLTHTPLSVRVDSRRTTFSDASSSLGPRSPLEESSSRKSSVSVASGARSASGASQTAASVASSTDTGRSVDMQREIDILSAILGGSKLAPTSRVEPRSHGRFKSETYARNGHRHPSNEGVPDASKAVTVAPYAAAEADTSCLSMENAEWRTQRRSKDEVGRPATKTFNTAPASTDANASLELGAGIDGVDVGDANRSAKRRLRSASRAGLLGLKELLKVFKSAGATEDCAGSASTAQSAAAADESLGDVRRSMDARPTTPSTNKQKRRSLNLKRRSFLRSKPSLEIIKGKNEAGDEAEAMPPMPSATESVQHNSQTGTFTQDSSPARHETRSMAGSSTVTTATSSSKTSRRISLQSSWNASQRRSLDGVQIALGASRGTPALRQASDSRSTKRAEAIAAVPDRGGGTLLRPPERAAPEENLRRASTSVDAMHKRPEQPVRSHSALESPTVPAPMVPKLALRPEAMPGLLVYVQATKQHLQAAIDQLGAPMASHR